MKPHVPATRSSLLVTRARRRIAERGASIIRGKRSALANELFRVLSGVIEGRHLVERRLGEATRALELARAIEGEGALTILALDAAREVPVEVRLLKVWGVPTPELEAPSLTRTPEARGGTAGERGLCAVEAAEQHELALEALLDVASRELLLRRLGDEIRETSRRINALEQEILPALAAEARRIADALEEREREELARRHRMRRSGSPRLGPESA
mgnify:CR=1 FL=1